MEVRNGGCPERFIQCLYPGPFPAEKFVEAERGFLYARREPGVAALNDLQSERFGGTHPFPPEPVVECRDFFQIRGNVAAAYFKQKLLSALRIGFQQFFTEENPVEQEIDHGKYLPERWRECPAGQITMNFFQVPQVNPHDVAVF